MRALIKSVELRALSITNIMKEKKVSQEDLENNFVPLHVRDRCAGILIPLNK